MTRSAVPTMTLSLYHCDAVLCCAHRGVQSWNKLQKLLMWKFHLQKCLQKCMQSKLFTKKSSTLSDSQSRFMNLKIHSSILNPSFSQLFLDRPFFQTNSAFCTDTELNIGKRQISKLFSRCTEQESNQISDGCFHVSLQNSLIK